MELLVNPLEIKNALGMAIMAMPSRSVLEHLEGVLIKADEDNVISITCTDSQTEMTARINGSVREPGSVVVRGKLIYDMIKRFPEHEINIKTDEKHCTTLKCGNCKTSLSGMDATTFPNHGQERVLGTLKLKQETLRKSIAMTESCISQDMTRPVLAGICLKIDCDTLCLTACDGFRLATVTMECESDVPSIEVIVPQRAVNMLKKLLGDNDEPVELTLCEDSFSATIGETTLYAKLLNGRYIDWQKIMPQSSTISAEIDASELRDAIERAALIACNGLSKSRTIRINIIGNHIEISAKSDIDTMLENIDVEHSGDDIAVMFNATFICEMVRSIGDGTVKMQFNTPTSPLLVSLTHDDSARWLLLPVRM